MVYGVTHMVSVVSELLAVKITGSCSIAVSALIGLAVCRVHDLRSMRQVAFLEAHDAEVLCLEFTRPASGKM